MGNDSTIKTGSYTDPRDGQVYKTVTIGELEWMAENFRHVTKCSCGYDNDESKEQKYGRLYKWCDAKVSCPDGWRLPSEVEWDKLVKKAGGSAIAGKMLKPRFRS